jgi:GNAT superfamily N-acetyltransferase
MAVEIRDASERDAPEIAPILDQLGHGDSTPAQVRMRLTKLAQAGDRVLVAVFEGRVVGVATVHVASLIHQDLPTARLMALVVDEASRGQGVGRLLVEEACRMARRAGCDRIELTSRLSRTGAHAFYERLGFTHTSKRFSMQL